MSKGFIVGLTGPTGAGKSAVAAFWKQQGCCVIDADVLSRRAVEPDSPCLREIVKRFSDSVLNPDGSLNRKALAAIAFSSPEATKALNAIVHPAVCRMIEEELLVAQNRGFAVAVIDAPLLFEAQVDRLCDETVAVLAPVTLRRQRICERDGLTMDQADRRIEAQPSDEFYRHRATHILENTTDLLALQHQALQLWQRWKEHEDE